jgi:transposase
MELVAKEWAKVEIYTVWDNLNTHYDGPSKRWTEFNARHGDRFHFVYTPIHASWMNQVEVWFSILERRLLRHGDFYDAAHMAHRVHSFIHHWNRHEAHPFRWTWRSDRVDNPKRKVTA